MVNYSIGIDNRDGKHSDYSYSISRYFLQLYLSQTMWLVTVIDIFGWLSIYAAKVNFSTIVFLVQLLFVSIKSVA
jgi:hypothetical protein